MPSESTVGWLLLAAALASFAIGLSLRAVVGRRPRGRIARGVRRVRESRVGAIVYGPVAVDALDGEELDQTILMPAIVVGCGFLLTSVFLLGYEIVT